jgi:3-methyladenine DNA glycosylase/8-oxoguanine DNA glycosylase
MSDQLTMTIPPRAIGELQAEACLEKTREVEATWPERAWAALVTYINIKRGAGPWTAEQAVAFVLRQPGIEPPHDTRCFGKAFSRAAKAGLIRRSTETYHLEHGHGKISLKWETV